MGITNNKTIQIILIKVLGILGSIIGITAFAVSFTPLYGVNSIYIGLIGLIISGIALYLGIKYHNSTSRGIIIIGIITSILGLSFGYYQKRRIDKLTNTLKEPIKKIKTEVSKAVDKGAKGIEEVKKEGAKHLEEIKKQGAKHLEDATKKGKEQLQQIQKDGTKAIKNKLSSFLDDDDDDDDSNE